MQLVSYINSQSINQSINSTEHNVTIQLNGQIVVHFVKPLKAIQQSHSEQSDSFTLHEKPKTLKVLEYNNYYMLMAAVPPQQCFIMCSFILLYYYQLKCSQLWAVKFNNWPQLRIPSFSLKIVLLVQINLLYQCKH